MKHHHTCGIKFEYTMNCNQKGMFALPFPQWDDRNAIHHF